MQLVDLKKHLNNNNIYQVYRKPDFRHDVFQKRRSNETATVPIHIDEIDDALVDLICDQLGCESPFGSNDPNIQAQSTLT